MFRIDLLFLSGFAGSPIAKALRLRNWIAFLLSFAAHFFLIYIFDTYSVSIREPRQARPSATTLMNVRLVDSEAAAGESGAKASDFDDRREAIWKPLRDYWAVPANPLADLTPPTFEILLPPLPYYFQERELSEKPHGSLDIPSELATALASEPPRSALLRLRINERGEVDQVIIDQSNFSEAEKQRLIDTFQNRKFDAGKIGDQAVKSELSFGIKLEKRLLMQQPD